MAQHDIVVPPLTEALTPLSELCSDKGVRACASAEEPVIVSNTTLIQWEESSMTDVWYKHVACVGLVEAKLPSLLYPEVIDFDSPEKA